MLISFPGANRKNFSETHARGSAPLAPALQHLRGYWEALRDGPLPPMRSQIDPRGMESALGGAFIIERVAPGIGRFRIAGSQLADLIGCDPRGMPVSILFDPQGRKHLSDDLEKLFATPAMLDLRVEAERGIGKPMLSAQLLILPLRNDWGKTELAIGAMALTGDIGRKARRFFVGSTTVTPIAGGKVVEPVIADPVPAPAPEKPTRPHLRLVHSVE